MEKEREIGRLLLLLYKKGNGLVCCVVCVLYIAIEVMVVVFIAVAISWERTQCKISTKYSEFVAKKGKKARDNGGS